MNGKPLQEIDEIIYAVCTLCRDHEKAGFVEGVKVGMGLAREVSISLVNSRAAIRAVRFSSSY